jgi:hypothetical protein
MSSSLGVRVILSGRVLATVRAQLSASRHEPEEGCRALRSSMKLHNLSSFNLFQPGRRQTPMWEIMAQYQNAVSVTIGKRGAHVNERRYEREGRVVHARY